MINRGREISRRLRNGDKLVLVKEPRLKRTRKRSPTYDRDILTVLKKAWGILNYPCGKRRAASLPEVLDRLGSHGELALSPEKREKLLLGAFTGKTCGVGDIRVKFKKQVRIVVAKRISAVSFPTPGLQPLSPLEEGKTRNPGEQDDRITRTNYPGRVVRRLFAVSAGRAEARPYLVEDRATRAEIVIAENPPRLVTLAAEELRNYVRKITCAQLPVVTVPGGALMPVFVGRSRWTDKLGVGEEVLSRDGFRMRSRVENFAGGQNWLVLVGRNRDFEPREPWPRNNGRRRRR